MVSTELKHERRVSVKSKLSRTSGLLGLLFLAVLTAAASDHNRGRDTFVLTSTNDPNANQVVVFQLNSGATPTLTLVNTLPTGGKGGAGGNAAALQFQDSTGAV